MKFRSNLASVIFVFAWVSGVVLAPVGGRQLGAIIFPPYSYYILMDRVIAVYAPELRNN